ncbi:MAG: GDP-mannose 4,6-dehydratase [Chloroflexi bacterium]|nr:MAG: GDP-mannose 4,6-dehydratase [Chloroflexota bacterium]
MRGKRVVITGGAGFIGSNLAEELAGENEVILIDDLSTGKVENIEGLLKRGAVKLVKGSVTDLDFLREQFKGADYVFHLAALPSVPRSVADPLASNEINLTGTLNVLIAARDNRVSKVIYASSSSVYGDMPNSPKSENMPPSPMSPYGVGKLAGEYYCQVFTQVYGLPTISLRYFNVYGPKQDPSSEYAAVIPRFIVSILKGEPPIIFGDGQQTRDFTFVQDVVEANILAAESEATGVFNVGSGSQISINELARLIRRLVGKNLELVHASPRPGDVRHSLADISKAEEAIGYRPRYNLEQGLKETIEWFSSRI